MQHLKKKVLLVIIVVTVFILFTVVFYCLQPQLTTGTKKDIQSIVIVERYPGEGGGKEGEPKSITTITDYKTMNDIYNKLKCARPIKETIGERFYTMVSPRYEISIHYSDHTDEIMVYLAGAVRYLERADRGITVSNSIQAKRIITFLERIMDNN